MRNTYSIIFLFTIFFSQALGLDKIAVFSGGSDGLVEIESDALNTLIEEELKVTEIYEVIGGFGSEAPLTFKKDDRSALGQITSNIWRATADTLSASVGNLLDGSNVIVWRLERSGRTYSFDFRLYSVEIDGDERHSFNGKNMDKRYLKGRARSTSRFTGTPENAAEAARLMAWQVVGLRPPDDRFGRGIQDDIFSGLRTAYNTFWFLADSGFESLLIIVALLVMGGALVNAADPGEDLGYPPDYPGVP